MTGNWLITEVRELVLWLECAQSLCTLKSRGGTHIFRGLALAREDAPVLLKHMARIKQCERTVVIGSASKKAMD